MYKLQEKKIIFYNDELFPHLPCLGYGSQGDVYKFRISKDIYALKVFNGLNIEKLEDYEPKLEINIDSYITPLKLLYVNDEFKGYIMKYCRGKNLEQRPKLGISINEFAESSAKLFDDTNKLTNLKYSIFDTFISNIMYDEGFKMIDIDRYPYEKNKSFEEVQELNNRRLNQILVDVFINSTGLANMFFRSVELKKLMTNCVSGKITFEELFNEICTIAYNVADEEVVNVEDIGKVLRKVKK